MKHYIFIRQMPPVIVWGGLEKLMMDWFERIDYSQCSVTLIVSAGSKEIYTQYAAEKNLPMTIIEFPFRQDFRYVDKFFKRLIKTYQLLKKLKPSQILFFQGSYSDFDLSHVLAGFLAAKGNIYMHENLGAPTVSVKTSKKHFGFIPGVGLWWYQDRYFTAWRPAFCKKILVVGQELKNRLVSLRHYSSDKIKIQYHGISLKEFYPSKETSQRMRKTLGILESNLVIIVSARLSKEKCIHRAIESFNTLSEQFSNLNLVIAGTGPLEQELKTLAESKKHKNKILFLGHVHRVSDYLKMSDIFVLPSDNEGLSIASLEALATGLTCVVTRCPGATEILKSDYGFLTEKTIESVQEGLYKAISLSKEDRIKNSQLAVQYAQENFEINKNIHLALEYLNIPYKANLL